MATQDKKCSTCKHAGLSIHSYPCLRCQNAVNEETAIKLGLTRAGAGIPPTHWEKGDN